MVQAGQGQLTIHEATLDGSVLEEPFLKEGRGSAFESRPGTLVVLRATERGLGLLRRKIEQLVGRGFHAIDVAFDGVGDRLKSPDEAWIGIRQGAQYAEQFAAWLVLSDAKPAVQAALEKAAARDGSVRVELFADARAAGEALRRRELEANDGVEPLAVGSSDATLSQGSDDTVDPNDWGWGSQDTTDTVQPGADLPAVDVAEVLLQADELATLRDRTSQLVKRGKRYLTLRMHFKRDRRMSESDMAALVAARDQLAAAGGQLVLASLQEEVLKWLKLLDEDRHFVVADSADAADLAHRRHAAGLVTTAPAAADAPPFVVASSDAKRIVVRPRGKSGGKGVTAALRVVALGKDGLPHLAGRLERIARDGVRDIAVDLARFKDIRGERFDAVPGAVEKARARGARVAFASASRDVKALLKLLGLDPALAGETLDAAALALAAAHHAAAPFEELRYEVTREELLGAPPVDPVSSVDMDELEVPADAASSSALSAEVDALKAQLAAARAESKRAEGELQDARRAAEAATKAAAEAKRLEAELATARKQLDEHRKQADAAKRLADEQKKYADAERTRVTELELLATQDGRDREELEARLAAAGESEAKLADLEARLKDREARASSLEKALEALQDRAQELEAAAYKLPQLEKQLESRDAALAEQKAALAQSQASVARELEEHNRVVARLERDLRDAREVAGTRGQAAESAQADRVRELEQAVDAAEAKARAAESKASAAEAKARAAEQKGAGKSAGESAAEAKAAQAEQRASAAEAEARRASERAASLEKELAKAKSAPAPLPAAPAPLPSLPGSAADLQKRVAELERKNAQILTEAEEEIARLTREQAQLREELESAGDMIERLGKELEFS